MVSDNGLFRVSSAMAEYVKLSDAIPEAKKLLFALIHFQHLELESWPSVPLTDFLSARTISPRASKIDAVHLAGADQPGEARLGAAALVRCKRQKQNASRSAFARKGGLRIFAASA